MQSTLQNLGYFLRLIAASIEERLERFIFGDVDVFAATNGGANVDSPDQVAPAMNTEMAISISKKM